MVYKLQLVVVSLVVAVCLGQGQGHTLQNPVLENVKEPKVLMLDSLYFMVAKEDQDNSASWFPIYVSANLEKWLLISYAFDSNHYPNWTSVDNLHDPFLHYEGGYFYLFFRGLAVGSVPQIGVAKSKIITGPYIPEPEPLTLPTSPFPAVYYPFIVVDNKNGDNYLIWTGSSFSQVLGQQIYLADLKFSSLSAQTLLDGSSSWERYFETSSAVYRNGYYYLFYTSGNYCTYDSAIGVARSRFPLGQYENRERPLLLRASEPNVIKDVDGSSDILLYQASCSAPTSINATTLLWDSDDWPVVVFS